MKMPKQIDDKLVPWTLELAQEVQDAMARFWVMQENTKKILQRDERDAIIASLTNKMSDGRYTGGDVIFCYYNGMKIGVNGYHQSKTILETGVIPEAKVRIKEYQCDSMEEVILVYNQCDDPLHARRPKDKARAYSYNFGENWPEKAINLVSTAVASLLFKDYLEYDKKIELALSEEWKPRIEFVKSIVFDEGYIRHLEKISVIKVMMLSYKISPAHAKAFWTAVRDGSNISAKNPAKVLRDFLVVPRHGHIEISNKCILAWNYWIQNHYISHLKNMPGIDMNGPCELAVEDCPV